MAIPEILTHKKFQAGIIASLTIFLGQFLPAYAEGGDVLRGLAAVNWVSVGAPITAAILGQGLADLGKEAEKVKQNGGAAQPEPEPNVDS